MRVAPLLDFSAPLPPPVIRRACINSDRVEHRISASVSDADARDHFKHLATL